MAVPTYDRTALVPAIVHIGVGGFHRAHQGMYYDDLARRGSAERWGVVGVGLHRPEMKEVMAAQDCLYTVVERGPETDSARVVGAMCRYLYAPDAPAEVHAALADPRTRIVSLTITADGYCLDPATGTFDPQRASVKAQQVGVGEACSTWALLCAALDERRRAGTPPFTVMSCDNVPGSGAAAREALVSFAALHDPELSRWIDRCVTFPSTMVDRITPKTSPEQRDEIEQQFGVADRWPVLTEPFTQWVIEDDFCNGRPPWEDVGVEMVADVAGYKLIKTRLLNGIHCAVSYVGILAGYRVLNEAMADPSIHRYVRQLMSEEIAPLLPTVTGWDVTEYCATTMTRLTNPRMSDELSRLAARGSTKMPSYLLPSLTEARSRRRPHRLLTLAVAAWLRYLRGYDAHGNPLDVQDPRAEQLCPLAERGQRNPKPLLALRDIFGDLTSDDDFAETVAAMLTDIDRFGMAEVLRRHTDDVLTTVA
ncbi:mannitol dehydrogenase family protein [Mycobacterium sp. MYCO198283]|uniref:mannitol dehydrogenase family protein n=1 Tax=Mycobacterium sp. MYCO198283 TaxID=2883505 RepID=UPI001E3E04C9|nr:mannitol dehydrogenase family protein [Mycobacterium sp. MYCO198283]MCG5431105.1 mannitol dehydrogenase family protein [Mycobacterium sp. MYCO198283]